MEILTLLLNVTGATMLLLFGVSTVQMGVQRSFGSSFRSVFSGKKSRFQAAVAGLVMAAVLQSSAAVALLSASFVAAAILDFSTALSVVLGADLGSALVVQLLSFRLEWLVPLLLAVGGWLFVYSPRSRPRQAGRLLLGVAFILISLGFLREAFEPVRNSGFLPLVAAYLEQDFVAAFLVGAGLTFLMHSSVAVILICVTLVNLGTIPFDAGLSLVLGANLGSSLLPIWLSRKFEPLARRVTYANLAVRGSLAVLALVAIHFLGPVPSFFYENPAQGLIYVHLLFNSILLMSIPFLGFLEYPVALLLPERRFNAGQIRRSEEINCLDPNVMDSPNLALASVRREILRMSQIVTAMANPILDLYRDGDNEGLKQVREMDAQLNEALADIRRYVAALPFEKMTKQEKRLARDLTEVAVDLEAAGDIVSKQLVRFAELVERKKIRFSDEGWAELTELYSKVTDNMAIAFGTLATDDVAIARYVVEEKAEVRKMERISRKRHFKRLRQGLDESFQSSDMHLETLRALKDLNSKVAAVSYPVLLREGQLRDTRLV
ncbi:MAG: Na/Pi cotransporter family protein [Albidovulum sp.]|nr:Na/Pi cotransporter family protein [Albidovulum sp.]